MSSIYTPLDSTFSDGAARYPQNQTKVVKPDGSYEYYCAVEHGAAKDMLWRAKTAKNVVENFGAGNYPAGDRYIFRAFPENYKLFEHIKGTKREDGTVKERTDTYLYGHPSGKRFRSPAEFYPHINYLAQFTDTRRPDPNQPTTCSCQLCTTSRPSVSSNNNQSEVARTERESETKRARMTVAAEERMADQDCAGWILRKGEVVWMWQAENNSSAARQLVQAGPLVDGEGGMWLAGIVIGRPAHTVPLRKTVAAKESATRSFSELDMEGTPPWETTEEGGLYSVQLCSETSAPGRIFRSLPQRFVQPWLSHPESSTKFTPTRPEHPSIPAARKICTNFSLFDPDTGSVATTTTPTGATKKITNYNGVFLGAEKLWVNEPLRLKRRNTELPSYIEDVMIPSRIYTSSTPSTISAAKVTTAVIFSGIVLTSYFDSTTPEITPELFSTIHPRMRREDGSTSIIRWYSRATNKQEVSITFILGRWYEPQAIQDWTNNPGWVYGREENRLVMRAVELKKWADSRAEALGCESLNGVDLIDRKVVKTRPAVLVHSSANLVPTGGDLMDLDDGAGAQGGAHGGSNAGRGMMAQAKDSEDDSMSDHDGNGDNVGAEAGGSGEAEEMADIKGKGKVLYRY